MLKRTQLAGIITAAVLLLGPAVGVKAAGDVGSASTNVTVNFLPGGGPTSPVDPTNPTGGPVTDPTNPGTGATGALRLNYVSNVIAFGGHTVSATDQKYLGTPGSNVISGRQSAQVSDERGTNAGWALKVSGTPLVSTDSDTLEGATLKLPAGTVATASGTSNGAVSSAVTNALSTGGVLLSAPATKGAGLTVDSWLPGEVELNVLGGTAEAKAYSTSLTWTLQDTPGS